MKAQIALEYIIATALAIAILTPILLYATKALDEYRESNRLFVARTAATKLGQAADWVFSQGPPARLEIEVFIPEGIEEINISNKMIVFKVRAFGGLSTISYFTLANVSGSIPSSPGSAKVKVEVFETEVRVSA